MNGSQLKFKKNVSITKCNEVRPSQQKRTHSVPTMQAALPLCRSESSDAASGTGMNVVQLRQLQCADQGHGRMIALRRPAHPMSQSQLEWSGKRPWFRVVRHNSRSHHCSAGAGADPESSARMGGGGGGYGESGSASLYGGLGACPQWGPGAKVSGSGWADAFL